MMYQPGDYVCPSDLPRRFLCRVQQVEPIKVGDGFSQILKLEPLEGPWPSGTCLIRLDGVVAPVPARCGEGAGSCGRLGVKRLRMRTRAVAPCRRLIGQVTR